MTVKLSPTVRAFILVALVAFAVGAYLNLINNGCGGSSDFADFVDNVRAWHTPEGC